MSTVRPILPSARPSNAEIRQISTGSAESKEVGLGLDLDNKKGATPLKLDEFGSQNSRHAFSIFDGEWNSSQGELSEVEREWDDNLMRNVTVRRRPNRKAYIYDDSPIDRELFDDNSASATSATRLLGKYPVQDQIAVKSRKEGFSTAMGQSPEPSNWSPMATSATDFPSTPDLRRLSNMSAKSSTSTTVEAMVVDVRPQRQQTLRHARKRVGLREFSAESDTQSHVDASKDSSDLPHRLLRKTPRIPDRRYRSLGSNPTVSSVSSARSRREIWESGGIPVVVVPERGSSSKSSKTHSLRSTSSRRTKRSISLTNASLSQPAKSVGSGNSDLSQRRTYTVPASGRSSESRSERTIDYPPRVPVRSSSLSAPTSRNTSRAGSLTAESLKAHNMSQALEFFDAPESRDLQPSTTSPHTPQMAEAIVDHNGDPFFGNRLSAQVTPFSQLSYGTAGTTAEIGEALAVSIFPHHNTSLLMVQHLSQSEGPSKPILFSNMDITKDPISALDTTETKRPQTPVQAPKVLDEVDSPLRNPREPPVPPTIQFIPATPSGLTPTSEFDKQLTLEPSKSPKAESMPKRGLSLVRRALSKRRNSESILFRTFSGKRHDMVDGTTQTSKPNANLSTSYPSVEDRPADGSRLHPFWRPSHFWDDLEDEHTDNADYQNGRGFSSYEPHKVADRHPQPPKRSISGSLKRTFAILPINDGHYYDSYRTERRTVRRTPSGNLRVVKASGSRESLRRPPISNSSPHSTMREVSGNERRPLGTNGSLTASWKDLGRRMSEKRRERRTEKIRTMISGPRDAFDGVDNILKKGQQPHYSAEQQQHELEKKYGMAEKL